MILEHSRTQHPIGQGFFHTASVEVEDRVFNYVYDCGSMDAAPLDSAIGEYVESLDGTNIDLLFLSHLDNDHVSGLERLLVLSNASTAVLPYLSPVGRLILIARAIENGTITGSLLGLLSDPTGWLTARGVESVIFIAPAAPPPEAPPDWTVPGEPGPFLGIDMPPETRPDERRTHDSGKIWLDTWSIVDDTDGLRTQSRRNTQSTSVMSCLQPLRLINSNIGWLNWQFVTFVHPEGKREENFLQEVKRKFPGLIPRTKFELDQKKLLAILQNPADRKVLAGCYSMIHSNRNMTSLSVYSGPIKIPREGVYYSSNQYPHRDLWPFWFHPELRVAWLGTGDSNFGGPKRRNAFRTHYESLKGAVLTFSLPHHGARKHFHRDLVEFGRLFVASAGESNRWGHPHPETTILVHERDMRFLWSTTESKVTQLTEQVTIET